MSAVTAVVARRELRGYFDQPTAYVLIVAFLGLALFLLFRSMYAMGVATLRPLFDLLPVLFSVFIPAVTMRALAEERRGRTLDWLVAQPLDEGRLVLGKFLGLWSFVLVALAGTLPAALGLLAVSEADPGIVVAQYVGAALLGGQSVALGLWASSLTRNQITAFIVGAGMSFLLVLIGMPVVQIGLPPVLSGALARLSVVTHFENIARGVIDLRDALYFISAAALFLLLTVGTLQRERLSPERPEFGRLRLGLGVMVAVTLLVNLLGSHVRGRLDLTRGELYTLSPGTRDLLEGVDDLVRVRLFASQQLPPEIQIELRDVRDLLADMERAAGGNLEVVELDPDESEEAAEEASSYGITPIEFNVLRDDEFQIRRGYYGLVVSYAGEAERTPIIERTDDLEFQLASQIHSLTVEERPEVAFLRGFGARSVDAFRGLRARLSERYDVTTVDLAADSAPPLDSDSVAVLVVAGPTQPLDSMSVDRIRTYMRDGGSALFLLEPVDLAGTAGPMGGPRPVRSGLEALLEERGLEVAGDLVMDLASAERVSVGRQGPFSVVAPYPLWPVASPADHAITRGLNALTLGWATAVRVAEGTPGDPLWRTSEAGALRNPELPIDPDQQWAPAEEGLETLSLAVAQHPPDSIGGGRVVVVGDASFLEPQFVQANPANQLFFENAVDWLAQEEALIAIRSKDRTPPPLTLESEMGRTLLKWGNLLGVPLLFALLGVLRVGGRVRRARGRWQEVMA